MNMRIITIICNQSRIWSVSFVFRNKISLSLSFFSLFLTAHQLTSVYQFSLTTTMLRVYYILSYNFAHSIMGWDSIAPRQWTFGRFFFVIRRKYSLHFVWNLNFIPRNKNSRSYFTWMHKTWKHINSMWNLFKILNNFLRSQLYWVNAFNAHVCVPMHMVRWYIQCIFVSIIQSQRFIQFSFHTIDTRTAHTIKLLPSVHLSNSNINNDIVFVFVLK